MSATRPAPLRVIRDDDGGLTIHDDASGVVLSVVRSHPAAHGPRLLIVEPYAYATGKRVHVQAVTDGRHPRYVMTALEEPAL